MSNVVTVSDNIAVASLGTVPAATGTFVQLSANSGAGGSFFSTVTDATGNFVVAAVPPGVYTVYTAPTSTGPWMPVNQSYRVQDVTSGLRIFQGPGAPPNAVNGAPPVVGDLWLRTDTPVTVNQRIYICTTGGTSPAWSGVL